jgi:hypothetical protein
VLLSLCYLLVRRVLDLAIWSLRSNNRKELEITVLRHELAILRRHTKRPPLTTVDRPFLAAASRLLTRTGLESVHRHAGDAPTMASSLSGEALDVYPFSRSPADPP